MSLFALPAGLAGQVNIDTNGDRIADYSLLDMDPATDTFRVSTRLHSAQGAVHSLLTRPPYSCDSLPIY
jgi:hypothetical protein